MAEAERQNSDLSPADPDALAKALELELRQKRARWQRVRERRGTWRALGILVVLVVLIALLVGWLYLLPELSRSQSQVSPTPTMKRAP